MKAKVTLKEMLSLSVGSYRFVKNQPVVVEDPKLLAYVKNNPWFISEELKGEKKVKAASKPAASSSSSKTSGNEGKDEIS